MSHYHSFPKELAVTLEHVEHRVPMWWTDPVPSDERVWQTQCLKRFVPGGTARDAAVHEPIIFKCKTCYG